MSRTYAVLLRTQSDERLVELARQGHTRAFETIVRRYRRPLLAASRRIVDDGRAEDVLQQALLLAWRGLERGDHVREVRAWLFQIVRNAAVSDRRRAGLGGMELLEALSVAASPEEEAERRAVIQATLEAIADLPERQREALLSIAVQGRSQDEVARELGLSTTAVRQLVHRARTSIRATATAIAPLSLVARAADAGLGASDSMTTRIASLIAAGGSAGAGVTFAKVGAVAGVAATAVSGPTFVETRPPRPAAVERSAGEPRARAPERATTALPPIVPVATAAPTSGARKERTKAVPRSGENGRNDDREPPSRASKHSGGNDAEHHEQDDDQGGEDAQRRVATRADGESSDGGEERRDDGDAREGDTGADRQVANRDDGESDGGQSGGGDQSGGGGAVGEQQVASGDEQDEGASHRNDDGDDGESGESGEPGDD